MNSESAQREVYHRQQRTNDEYGPSAASLVLHEPFVISVMRARSSPPNKEEHQEARDDCQNEKVDSGVRQIGREIEGKNIRSSNRI